jgi:hypothetical protein
MCVTTSAKIAANASDALMVARLSVINHDPFVIVFAFRHSRLCGTSRTEKLGFFVAFYGCRRNTLKLGEY